MSRHSRFCGFLPKLGGGIIALSLMFGAPIPASAQKTSCPADILDAPIYWDIGRLGAVKSQISVESSPYKLAFDRLLEDADEALEQKPYTVTDKTKPGPSGDLKDYVSLSRYFWPNPKTKDGLPYIRKDGHSNPELSGEDFDRRRSQLMTGDVMTLSLAAYFTGDEAYAEKAKRLVQVWFLDTETAMNPHLKYAQGAPGRSDGREFGILDGRIYWDVMDSMLLLQSVGMIDEAFTDELRTWFGHYAAWMIRSDFGKKASARKNNHGTFFDAQLAHVLMFIGRCDIAKKVVTRGHNRTEKQIDPSGLMPHEKVRTQSLVYHSFNLKAFLRLAYFARKLDMDFYAKAEPGAGSIQDAVDFVSAYAGRIDEWPYKEINKNPEKAAWDMLKHAQYFDDRQEIKDALARLSYDNPKHKSNLILGR